MVVNKRKREHLKDGELIKQKEICRWCGKEFITFERIPGGSIRGRYYCCIEHSCMALAKEKEEERKAAKKDIEKVKAAAIARKECPACGVKFTTKSKDMVFCDKCKYIGWAKRNAMMLERKQGV